MTDLMLCECDYIYGNSEFEQEASQVYIALPDYHFHRMNYELGEEREKERGEGKMKEGYVEPHVG